MAEADQLVGNFPGVRDERLSMIFLLLSPTSLTESGIFTLYSVCAAGFRSQIKCQTTSGELHVR